MRSPITRHSIWQVGVDAALIALAWWLAWNLRFEGRPVYYDRYLDVAIIALVVGIKLPVFALSGFYNRWWRYVSTRDMWTAFRGVVLASVAVFLVFTLFDVHRVAVPRGVWFIDLLLCLALVAGSRLLARTLIERPLPGRIVARGKEVVVVGAGDAGQLVVKEMQRSPALGYTPIGLLDDDPRKRNLRLHGVRVLGTVADLEHVVRDRRPDEVLIAIPTASGELRARIVDTARSLHVPVKTLPSLSDLVSGDRDLARQLRPVEVEDVLGREPVDVDIAAISDYLANEVVLVTGAGGSIGSELCRQIARVRPAKLVLLDNAEPALFEIERELVRERGFRAAAAVVGDVKDVGKLRQVCDKDRPGVVFKLFVDGQPAEGLPEFITDPLGLTVPTGPAGARSVRILQPREIEGRHVVQALAPAFDVHAGPGIEHIAGLPFIGGLARDDIHAIDAGDRKQALA